jgi:Low psii accumulation1 / Rep27
MKFLRTALFSAALVASADAFVSPSTTRIVDNHQRLQVSIPRQKETTTSSTTTTLWSDNSSKKKKGGLEEGMRNKLVTESIAPWRTLRLFLYGALGSGAFVGGLINLSGAVAASNRPEFNLQTEVSQENTYDSFMDTTIFFFELNGIVS